MLFVSVLCELGNRLLSVTLFRQSSGDGRSLCSGRSMPLVVCLLVYSVRCAHIKPLEANDITL